MSWALGVRTFLAAMTPTELNQGENEWLQQQQNEQACEVPHAFGHPSAAENHGNGHVADIESHGHASADHGHASSDHGHASSDHGANSHDGSGAF